MVDTGEGGVTLSWKRPCYCGAVKPVRALGSQALPLVRNEIFSLLRWLYVQKDSLPFPGLRPWSGLLQLALREGKDFIVTTGGYGNSLPEYPLLPPVILGSCILLVEGRSPSLLRTLHVNLRALDFLS